MTNSRGALLAAAALALALFLSPYAAGAQEASGPRVRLVRVADADSVAWILGSVHLAWDGVYPLGEDVEAAFTESARLAVELDTRAVDAAAVQAFLLRRGVLPGSTTLRSLLDAPHAAALAAHLADLGLPADALDAFQPWVAYSLLSSMDLLRMGYDPALGVDLYFLQRAGGREVVELETATLQLEALAGFGEDAQVDFLVDYIDGLDVAEEQTRELFDAWYEGDGDAMEAIIERSLGDGDAGRRAEEVLLLERNRGMADGIRSLLARPGSSFVVIGAAHTVGPGSVPDILAADGYTVSVLRN